MYFPDFKVSGLVWGFDKECHVRGVQRECRNPHFAEGWNTAEYK